MQENRLKAPSIYKNSYLTKTNALIKQEKFKERYPNLARLMYIRQKQKEVKRNTTKLYFGNGGGSYV